MKLLIVCQNWPDAVAGGSESQAFALSKELIKHGDQVEIWTRCHRDNVSPEGAVFKQLPRNAGLFSARVAMTIRKNDHPVIFAPLISSHSWVLSRRAPVSARLIVKIGCGGETGDVGTSLKRPWGRWKLRDVFERADGLVIPEESIRQELVGQGCPDSKIICIPNGVDLARFSNRSERQNLVLFVGRLVHQKGSDLLPAIWGDGFDGAKLRVIGSGTESRAVTDWAASRSDTEAIDFASRIEDHYKKAKVLILPSRYEGLANVLLEALAAGLRIVASDIPSNRQLAADFPDAVTICELTDSKAWQSAIEDALDAGSDPTIDKIERYSLATMVDLYKSLFEERDQ